MKLSTTTLILLGLVGSALAISTKISASTKLLQNRIQISPRSVLSQTNQNASDLNNTYVNGTDFEDYNSPIDMGNLNQTGEIDSSIGDLQSNFSNQANLSDWSNDSDQGQTPDFVHQEQNEAGQNDLENQDQLQQNEQAEDLEDGPSDKKYYDGDEEPVEGKSTLAQKYYSYSYYNPSSYYNYGSGYNNYYNGNNAYSYNAYSYAGYSNAGAGCTYFQELSVGDSSAMFTAMKGSYNPVRVYLKCCTSFFKSGCSQSSAYQGLQSYFVGKAVAQTTAQTQDNCAMLKKVEPSDALVKYTGLYKGERLYFACCAWGEWTGCHAKFWYSYLTATAPVKQ